MAVDFAKARWIEPKNTQELSLTKQEISKIQEQGNNELKLSITRKIESKISNERTLSDELSR